MVDIVGPILGDTIDVRDHALQFDEHLSDDVLCLGMMGHRAAVHGGRRLLFDPLDRQIFRALGKADIDVGELRLKAAEQRQNELIGAGETGLGNPK